MFLKTDFEGLADCKVLTQCCLFCVIVLIVDLFSSLSQSANYCRTTPTDNIGLMMLCEVALGNM